MMSAPPVTSPTVEASAPASEPRLEGSSARILIAVLGAVVAGGIAWLAGARVVAEIAWAVAVLVALVPLGINVAKELARGQTGVDVIALLAMVGALALGQYLAGAVIGLMLSGGEAGRFGAAALAGGGRGTAQARRGAAPATRRQRVGGRLRVGRWPHRGRACDGGPGSHRDP